MLITRVAAHDFKSWSDLDWQIEPGLTLLAGENGSGKSSTIDAMEYALFGATSDAGRLIQRGTDAASALAEVSCDAGELVVERTIRRSGRGTTVKLSVRQHVDGQLVSLSEATTTETQETLERLLGVTRETLRASALSAQGDGAAFTRAAPRDRKRILADGLGLDFWEPHHLAARGDLADAKQTAALAESALVHLDGAQARLADARERLDAAGIAVEGATADEGMAQHAVESAAADAEVAREVRRQHAAAVEAAGRAQADHARATADRTAADEALARAKAAAANAPSVEVAQVVDVQAATELAEAEAAYAAEKATAQRYGEQLAEARRELAAREAARDQHATDAAELEGRLTSATSGACPECGKALDQPEDQAVVQRATSRHTYALTNRDQEEAAAATWRSRLAALEGETVHDVEAAEGAAVRDARARALAAQKSLADAEAIALLADTLDAFQQRARDAIDREAETAEALRAATRTAELAAVHGIPADAEGRHQHAVAVHAQARQALATASADLARAEEAVKPAERDAERETKALAGLAAAQVEIADLKLLEAGFGPDGVQADLLDAALPQLEATANRVLADLDKPYRVELRSQKLLKSADRIADTLDVIAHTDSGEAAYEDFSGGERCCLDVALRIALGDLLATRAGARVRMLILDEPTGIDDATARRLAGVLEALIADGTFESIVLVTHHDALADLIGRVVRIEKAPTGESRIVGAVATQTALEAAS